MSKHVDFYFDFTSPYGYLGSTQIEGLASKHGATVAWHPILIGAAFKITGAKPLVELPMKKEYFVRDFLRSAKFYKVPFNLPAAFPVSGVAASRAYYWLQGKDEKRAVPLAKAIYKAYFVDGVNIAEAENVVKIAAAAGCDAGEVSAALGDQAIKDKTRAAVEAAIAKGVFGSPYVIVGNEAFWGVDRFDQLDRWLATGGW